MGWPLAVSAGLMERRSRAPVRALGALTVGHLMAMLLVIHVVRTVRWGLFFLVLAVVNETVWRLTSTATWVAFKVWGIIPLIFLFALAQTPLVMKHQAPGADGTGKSTQE